jgi:hypothetical protein
MCGPKYPAVFLLALLVAAWHVPAGRADEVLYWNSVALDLVRQSATNPPKASRDLAIVQASVYDALNAIDRTYNPLYFQPAVSGPASREAAVAAAACQALAGLYPSYANSLDNLLNTRLATFPDGAAKDNGIALGHNVANSMLAWRASDGWDAQAAYVGGTAPGQWRPTPPDFKPGLEPLWGQVTPFAIPDAQEFRPGPPPALNTPAYAAAINEVKLLGASNSTARTPDQAQIALFWDDPPGIAAGPPGKWNQIAQVLALQFHNTLAENARMFALLDIAQADAGIVASDTKYTYDFWRPETAIHLADTDGNPDTPADPDWQPFLTTPPFPEYISGHSTFGGAAAETLALFFGTDDISFEIQAGFGVLPGVARSFDSLSDAALENGLSRIYGGIHYSFSNFDGIACGRAIGSYVFENCAGPIPAPSASLLALCGAACLFHWRPRRP